MKKVLVYMAFFVALVGYAQQVEVKGLVLDGEDQEQPLAFAEVKVKGTALNTTTDMDGGFSMQLLPGTYTFVVQFIGYEPMEIHQKELSDAGITLDPVVLRARKIQASLVASTEE